MFSFRWVWELLCSVFPSLLTGKVWAAPGCKCFFGGAAAGGKNPAGESRPPGSFSLCFPSRLSSLNRSLQIFLGRLSNYFFGFLDWLPDRFNHFLVLLFNGFTGERSISGSGIGGSFGGAGFPGFFLFPLEGPFAGLVGRGFLLHLPGGGPGLFWSAFNLCNCGGIYFAFSFCFLSDSPTFCLNFQNPKPYF
ncbi:MAG: hypothetical protein UY40_C0025G0008 [candidate division CPR1 bacterium GW2011_GWC1_49_13]|uniref:Secreted protein n=1 Tax=candidate division CPR1 bacterium GW2011_GWC1_49_13 TaxID=1618342 RepID=A0A0G1YFV6_9BACT|nr:MAG: hypothetical protein UY40_C0025G0008 [candidate division CPR1 bacterium GW2011_GWC1_49_13]